MALIKCPECGRENVSDSAISCPGCGYAIKNHFDTIQLEHLKEEKIYVPLPSVLLPYTFLTTF